MRLDAAPFLALALALAGCGGTGPAAVAPAAGSPGSSSAAATGSASAGAAGGLARLQSAAAAGVSAANGKGVAVPNFSHVFVVVEENTDLQTVLSSGAAPTFQALAGQGAVAANYSVSYTHLTLPTILRV